MSDLVVMAFKALRARFFDEHGRPVAFQLRDKLNTQDDPFDEYLADHVLAKLPGITCVRAGGPLITPDIVLCRPDQCAQARPGDLVDNLDRIVGIEVKKIERTRHGGVARASGMDYNTTPPCGRIRVFDASGSVLDIRGFYLYVCLERSPSDARRVMVTALALVDGNVLNADFDLYLRITGKREKRVGLGTYADGADRARPMLIFANPLGASELDHACTLIHPLTTLESVDPSLRLVYRLSRSGASSEIRHFYCYRMEGDIPDGWVVEDLRDPFPTPVRETRTRPRGRFRLPFRVPSD